MQATAGQFLPWAPPLPSSWSAGIHGQSCSLAACAIPAEQDSTDVKTDWKLQASANHRGRGRAESPGEKRRLLPHHFDTRIMGTRFQSSIANMLMQLSESAQTTLSCPMHGSPPSGDRSSRPGFGGQLGLPGLNPLQIAVGSAPACQHPLRLCHCMLCIPLQKQRQSATSFKHKRVLVQSAACPVQHGAARTVGLDKFPRLSPTCHLLFEHIWHWSAGRQPRLVCALLQGVDHCQQPLLGASAEPLTHLSHEMVEHLVIAGTGGNGVVKVHTQDIPKSSEWADAQPGSDPLQATTSSGRN